MTDTRDIIERLDEIANLKIGDPFPPGFCEPNAWGPPLTKLLLDAKAEIIMLRRRCGDVE